MADAAILRKPRVLILYKRSSFLTTRHLPIKSARFRQNHINHYECLKSVEKILRKLELPYQKHCRGRGVNYKPFNLVITVGGDGTFLEAGRNLDRSQYILGVNSDPDWSVGQFCEASGATFEKILHKILEGQFKVRRLYKLRVSLEAKKSIDCLNDILVCHPNPAAMSRYEMKIRDVVEEHRSSGIWFATAAGSTGAILSAGGRKMPLESQSIQYRPRELYHARGVKYRLKGGILSPKTSLTLTSHMAHGRIFIDGAHISWPFAYGEKVRVATSPNFIQAIYV